MSSVSDGSGEEEQQIEIFKYLTQESIIQPNNERTQKIRREKREREMILKQEQDEQERMRKALDNEQKEKDKQLKDRLRAEAEKRKLQEIKKEEEIIELKDLKGNFGKTVLEIRSNVTALEMVMTGTEFTPV
jgi:rubrerythrin